MRPTNNEFAGWIDMIIDLIVEKMRVLAVLLFHAGYQYLYNILFDLRKHFRLGIEIVVLG